MRAYLEPDLIEATARYWSRFGEGRYAEAFEVVRTMPPSRPGHGQQEAAPWPVRSAGPAGRYHRRCRDAA